MKAFSSPACYIQGENALFEHARELLALGSKPLLLCDRVVFELVGRRLLAYLTRYGMQVSHTWFDGEVSEREITRLLVLADERQVDMVIGLGGGKTIDCAKALADTLELPIVVAPTLASTGAPASSFSAIYTDKGEFETYRFYNSPPDLVLVDSKIIAKAPKRWLASGIAHALATWVEAQANQQSVAKDKIRETYSLAAFAMIQQCERILFTDSLLAMEACEGQCVNQALERVIEANILLSGIGCWERTGLTVAHAICNGFAVLTGAIQDATYGEKLAYGTLVQLFLEKRPLEEVNRYIRLYQALQMPVTLESLHVDSVSYDDLLWVGQRARELHSQISWRISADEIAHTILAVDRHVKNLDKYDVRTSRAK